MAESTPDSQEPAPGSDLVSDLVSVAVWLIAGLLVLAVHRWPQFGVVVELLAVRTYVEHSRR